MIIKHRLHEALPAQSGWRLIAGLQFQVTKIKIVQTLKNGKKVVDCNEINGNNSQKVNVNEPIKINFYRDVVQR